MRSPYKKKSSAPSWYTILGTVWSHILLSVTIINAPEDRGSRTQGCCKISPADSLSWGSLRSKFLMRHLALADSVGGILNWPRRILLNSAVGSGSWKGYLPDSMVNNITPRLQTSAARPEYVWLVFSISGLTYAGHPCLSVSLSFSSSSNTNASSKPSSRSSDLQSKWKAH